MPARSFIKSAAVVAISCAYGVVASHYPGESLGGAAGELGMQGRTAGDGPAREMMRSSRTTSARS